MWNFCKTSKDITNIVINSTQSKNFRPQNRNPISCTDICIDIQSPWFYIRMHSKLSSYKSKEVKYGKE